MRIVSLFAWILVVSAPGCADAERGVDPSEAPPIERQELLRSEGAEGSPDLAPTREAMGPRILFLGTSLTEGYGLARPEVEAWPARIGALADSARAPVQIVNAGLSGETSAGALRRVDWVMRQSPDILVLETGANDGLRGIPVAEVEANLDAILSRVRETHPDTRVAIVAMEAPPNLGAGYTDPFREVFGRVAARWDAVLIPFLLDGVAGFAELNQGDAIHPTPEGHRLMAANAWPTLEPLIAGAGVP